MATWLATLFADIDYGERIGLMEDIRHDLEKLEERLHTSSDGVATSDRVLVLIDDLDRCEPEKAVEVLQAVNLLLNFSSFIVVLGIDARIITAAVQKHYEGLLGETSASGYEYLDKIVQIPFRIPQPNPEEIKTFLRLQLDVAVEPGESGVTGAGPAEDEPAVGGSSASTKTVDPARQGRELARDVTPAHDGSPSVGGDETVVPGEPDGPDPVPATGADLAARQAVAFTSAELEAFEKLAPFLRPNPRHLKRLINVYRLVRSLALARGDDDLLGNPAALLRWLVLWSQWPATAQTMLAIFDRLVATSGLPVDHLDGDPLTELHTVATPLVDADVRDQLDEDPRLLEALLAIQDCRLGWADIARIRRYTVNFNPAVEEYLRVIERDTASEEPAPA